MARTADRTEEREREIVALNGLQVLFAQVIFQSIRDDGDSGVADKVVHFRMNAMQQTKIVSMCREPLPPQAGPR